MGRNTTKPDRSESMAEEQSAKANGRGNPVRKMSGKEIQVAGSWGFRENGTFRSAGIPTGSHTCISFERGLKAYGIEDQRIRAATSRHNGKEEQEHRIDKSRFYNDRRMHLLLDGRRRLADYQKKSNDYIKGCLGMKLPNQVIEMYLVSPASAARFLPKSSETMSL